MIALTLLLAALVQDSEAVSPINCGGEQGTAFRVASRFVTAAHVVEEGVCRIGPGVVRVMSADARTDLAGGPSTGGIGEALEVSCDPIKAGAQYVLVGYPAGARGEPVRVFVRATGQVHTIRDDRGRVRFEGMASMRGLAERGMSGGPVLDEAGRVVGVISSVSPEQRLTLVQPLAATAYCS